MFHHAYHWMLKEAKGPRAVPALAAVSFIESSVFPLPPDLMLIPMCLAERKKAFTFAAICTVASVLGGMLGYAIGYFFYATAGQWILNLYGGAGSWYDTLADLFARYGAAIIMIKGLTPFPFKVLTILSGMVKLNFWVFVAASVVARAGRFFIVAGLLYFFGERIRGFLEKHLDKTLFAFFLLIVAGFVAAKFLLP
jgi:membrane protein YqaA with SNARE-associated domain